METDWRLEETWMVAGWLRVADVHVWHLTDVEGEGVLYVLMPD